MKRGGQPSCACPLQLRALLWWVRGWFSGRWPALKPYPSSTSSSDERRQGRDRERSGPRDDGSRAAGSGRATASERASRRGSSADRGEEEEKEEAQGGRERGEQGRGPARRRAAGARRQRCRAARVSRL